MIWLKTTKNFLKFSDIFHINISCCMLYYYQEVQKKLNLGGINENIRSKTFPGVAHAMAIQWAGYNKDKEVSQ